MRILVTGATGLIGTALVYRLLRENHDPVLLCRDPRRALEKLGVPCEAHGWQPEREGPPEAALRDIEAVVHLAGEPVAAGRWTEERKRRIRDSRIVGTRRLVDGLARNSASKPSVFVCASAIGYYGDRGEEILTEFSPPGSDFLCRVCMDWEAEARRDYGAPARRVLLRTGIVLSPEGGALARLLPPFMAGLGGPIAGGRAWMSWIHLEDLVSIIVEALRTPALEGPVNAVAPVPVRNRDFARALGSSLRRPAILPVPAIALRARFGEMAQALLASQRALPTKLAGASFRFRFETLEAALSDLLRDFHGGPVRELIDYQWVPKPVDEVSRLEALQPRWPYRRWEHTYSFTPLKGGTLLKDRVVYGEPWGWLGRWIAGRYLEQDVRKLFEDRRRKIREAFT